MQPNPLHGPPPAEVPLARSPLVRVVAQVRFPTIASVEQRAFIGPFQEAIRAEYPVLRPEQRHRFVLGPVRGVGTEPITAWRFHDPLTAWQVTLTPDFLALETEHYTSRDDFMGRLERVLTALVAHINPGVIDRLGVRYIDRLIGADLDDLTVLLHPAVCGVLASPLSGQAQHALAESVFVLDDEPCLIATRWGLLPARTTVDPGALTAIDERSWILDLDAFRAFEPASSPLEVAATVAQARKFAERIYSVFRWAVTDEFLLRHGGKP